MTQAARPVTLDTVFSGGVPEDRAVRVAFTGRALDGEPANLSLLVGDGDVATARRRALAHVGAAPSRAVFMQQVHGGSVARVDAGDAGRGALDGAGAVPNVDALVTVSEGLALAVLVADCVPVILVDPGRGVAAVHAGRGGVVQGIVPAAVAALAPAGAGAVVALIGPAIGGCCYEVPGQLAASVTATNPAAEATTTWGTPSLDLPAAVAAQLHAAGVARVERVGACTRCNDDMWFSHRSATAGRTAPGRQAGVVYRAPAAAPSPSSTGPSLQSP